MANLARGNCLAVAGLLAAALPAWSQAAAPPPAAAAAPPAAASVRLPVTVRDRHGAPRTDVAAADLDLKADGRPQVIRSFAIEPDTPLRLGLLIDTSPEQHGQLAREKAGMAAFLASALANGRDQAFLIHFDSQVELLQDLTAHAGRMQHALSLLATAPPDVSAVRGPEPGEDGPRKRPRGAPQMNDALYLAASELMSRQQGRKVLVILTEGVDRGSRETLTAAIEELERTGTVVYAVYLKGEQAAAAPAGAQQGNGRGRGGAGWPGGGGGWPGAGAGRRPGRGDGGAAPVEDGRQVLESLCRKTGGYMFDPGRKDSLEGTFALIAAELRSQFTLAFDPDPAARPGYHGLELTVRRKDATVTAPEGFYTP